MRRMRQDAIVIFDCLQNHGLWSHDEAVLGGEPIAQVADHREILSQDALFKVLLHVSSRSSFAVDCSCEAIIFVFLGVSTVSKQHDFDLSFVLITTVTCLVYRCAGARASLSSMNRSLLTCRCARVDEDPESRSFGEDQLRGSIHHGLWWFARCGVLRSGDVDRGSARIAEVHVRDRHSLRHSLHGLRAGACSCDET